MLYDDLYRHFLSKRAEARDPTLVISMEVAHVDIELLETCRVRVEGVMQAHGLTDIWLMASSLEVVSLVLLRHMVVPVVAVSIVAVLLLVRQPLLNRLWLGL